MNCGAGVASERRSTPTPPRWSLTALAIGIAFTVAAAGCGSDDESLPSYVKPYPTGEGPAYHPPSLSRKSAKGRTISGLACVKRPHARYAAHLEIWAGRKVVAIPPGIGMAEPQLRTGAYVRNGYCQYDVITREPTGLIEITYERPEPPTLGQFFDVWGQELSSRRIGSFKAGQRSRVRAFVNGAEWQGDPGAIPLNRHDAIALTINGDVEPHPDYRFPPGS